MSRSDRLSLYSCNKLKLGLFGANCSSGRAITKAPERWSGRWEDCLSLARMADDAGIEFMLRVGRWKGYAATPTTRAKRWRPSPGLPVCSPSRSF